MLLQKVILSFPHLQEKHAFNATAIPKYQVTLIIPKDHPQLKALKAEQDEAIHGVWGDEVPASVAPVIHDGTEMAKHGGYDDSVVYLVCKSEARIPLFDQNREMMLPDDPRLYAGCIVNASVDIYLSKKHNKYVAAGISGLQWWEHGTPLGGAAPATAEDFPEYTETAEDDFLNS